MSLNLNQIKASNHGEGPALVLAGPGSGKTHTLTNRIKNLIEKHLINPENILVITFSKASAMEMQNRFISLCENKFYPVTFGTFHSVFFNIIHNVYHYNTSHILNLFEKRKYMHQAIINAGLKNFVAGNCEYNNELVDTLLKEVGYYKNLNESEFVSSETNLTKEQFLRAYREYRNIQISENKIDFEDMLLIVRNIFHKNKEILNRYREKYQYIMIDEYQDINDIQYEIIRLMLGNKNNLWVCGDDDQSIYGFRGSRPEIMLNFKNDFKNTAEYNLNINYRCGQKIMDKAEVLISQNKIRYKKENLCGRERENSLCEIKAFQNIACEESYIVDTLLKYKDFKNTAILCRTNMEASKYAGLLAKHNISYEIKEKPCNPYNTQLYRDICNYIKLSQNINRLDIDYLFPILNKPSRYIRRDMITGDFITFEELINKYSDNVSMINRIKTFRFQLLRLQGMEPYAAISYIRKGIGLDEHYRIHLNNKKAYEEYLEKADDFKEKAKDFKCFKDMEEYVALYDEIIREYTNKNIPKNNFGDKVHIMTYHACKGLEFNIVILPHLNEGTVPHQRAYKENMIEEERRLLYVAMTRAKNILFLTYVKGNENNKSLPSRFLNGL